MQRITWYLLLAVGVLVAPIAGRAQAPKAQAPQATVRELATIDGDVKGFLRLPNGRILIYAVGSGDGSTFVYDIATKRSTLLGTDMYPAGVSPQGDRFAFLRSSEDHKERFLWTMPIDPKTGIATGQAQRVSLRPVGSGNAMFSPDGKMLAYRPGARSDGTWDIALVSATGGPERVVANYPDREAFAWAVDGKSLYVERGRRGPSAIDRVPVAGGRSEPLFPNTALTAHWVVGLSADARVALFQDNPDRFYYRTASGEEGDIQVPLPALDDGWGHDMSMESMRYATMTQVYDRRVRILNVDTGEAHDLLPGNESTSAPAWSPDGGRLAVLIGNLSHYEIAIMNADGSGLRRYPLPMQLDGWGEPWEKEMPWSPDGRFLAFRARDRRVVGWNDNTSQLALLDVTSGQTRVLASASPGMFGDFVWRSDGKAIRVQKVGRAGLGGGASIVEIDVDGTERLVRDIAAELPKINGAYLSLYSEVVVQVAANKAINRNVPDRNVVDRYVVPLDGGTVRKLLNPAMEPGNRLGGTQIDGNWLRYGQIDSRGEARTITFVSTVGEATRTLHLPFNGHHGANYPGGKQLLNVGKATGDTLWKIFLVPLDGSTPRLLGEIPGGTGGPLAASPDGRFVAYTSEGRYTSKIHEVDFGPALQAIGKR
jgi:Tol biopolymer transport system component